MSTDDYGPCQCVSQSVKPSERVRATTSINHVYRIPCRVCLTLETLETLEINGWMGLMGCTPYIVRACNACGVSVSFSRRCKRLPTAREREQTTACQEDVDDSVVWSGKA